MSADSSGPNLDLNHSVFQWKPCVSSSHPGPRWVMFWLQLIFCENIFNFHINPAFTAHYTDFHWRKLALILRIFTTNTATNWFIRVLATTPQTVKVFAQNQQHSESKLTEKTQLVTCVLLLSPALDSSISDSSFPSERLETFGGSRVDYCKITCLYFQQFQVSSFDLNRII